VDRNWTGLDVSACMRGTRNDNAHTPTCPTKPWRSRIRR
jgi:hypothetical protein